MKRTFRLYAWENSVGYRPPEGERYPSTDIVLDRANIPHGATVRVFEVLARDPLRSKGRYCSAMLQQTAIIIRHEVLASPPDGVEWDDDTYSEVSEWAEELASEFQTSCWNDHADNPWYGSSTFDKIPYVEVVVEVDDDDLEGLAEDAVDRKFEERLAEDESCPTWVVNPPEGSTKVGPDPMEDPDEKKEDPTEDPDEKKEDPVTERLTNDDVRHCIETYQGLQLGEEDPDGPETVCLSIGYADVYSDGDVVAYGQTLVNVSGLELDDVPDDDEPYPYADANEEEE